MITRTLLSSDNYSLPIHFNLQNWRLSNLIQNSPMQREKHFPLHGAVLRKLPNYCSLFRPSNPLSASVTFIPVSVWVSSGTCAMILAMSPVILFTPEEAPS